jgi:hypothetical protein
MYGNRIEKGGIEKHGRMEKPCRGWYVLYGNGIEKGGYEKRTGIERRCYEKRWKCTGIEKRNGGIEWSSGSGSAMATRRVVDLTCGY